MLPGIITVANSLCAALLSGAVDIWHCLFLATGPAIDTCCYRYAHPVIFIVVHLTADVSCWLLVALVAVAFCCYGLVLIIWWGLAFALRLDHTTCPWVQVVSIRIGTDTLDWHLTKGPQTMSELKTLLRLVTSLHSLGYKPKQQKTGPVRIVKFLRKSKGGHQGLQLAI